MDHTQLWSQLHVHRETKILTSHKQTPLVRSGHLHSELGCFSYLQHLELVAFVVGSWPVCVFFWGVGEVFSSFPSSLYRNKNFEFQIPISSGVRRPEWKRTTGEWGDETTFQSL